VRGEPYDHADPRAVLVAYRRVFVGVRQPVGRRGVDVLADALRASGPSSVPSSPGSGPVSTTSTKFGQVVAGVGLAGGEPEAGGPEGAGEEGSGPPAPHPATTRTATTASNVERSGGM